MAAIKPAEYARRLVQEQRHLDAAHLLEAALIMTPDDHGSRLLLARLYVLLKENHYRARARFHLEHLMDVAAPTDVTTAAANLLIKNVYLTNGPVEKILPLLERRPECFTPQDAAWIASKVAELDTYLKLDSPSRRRSTPPVYPAQVENLDLAMKGFIFKEFEAQIADKDLSGSYFTFGSCFAGNIARAMKAAGAVIESFWVGEEVNTTFSNVNLLRFILGEEVEHRDYYAAVLAGHDVAKLRAALLAADNVIYTLGLALAFFDDEQGYMPHSPANLRALMKRKSAVYRFSTVEENVAELETMRDLLSRHTKVRNVFLTVSPVPLAASLHSASAAVDDSESKAILRSAAGVMCRRNPDLFTYFPSFEVFRWLPCFRDEAAFGQDDGSLRHPNSHAVERVVSVFMDGAKVTAPVT